MSLLSIKRNGSTGFTEAFDSETEANSRQDFIKRETAASTGRYKIVRPSGPVFYVEIELPPNQA